MVETSIIIRTFNEQKHLPALFAALDKQSYRNFEVLVVDSGSFDRTREIAGAHADKVLRISSNDFTFGFSLNVGIEAAQGKFIAIVSAHTIPTDGEWLGRLIAPFRNENVAMVYGRQVGVPCSKFAECEDLERTFGEHARDEVAGRWAVNNANSAIRKDLWEQHSFDETLLGLEDIEWARHWMDRDYTVRYEPTANLIHIHEESWKQIQNRYFRESVSARHMGVMRRRQLPRVIGQELVRTVLDIKSALSGEKNPVKERLSTAQCLREILYFRAHKTIGQTKGLMISHPLHSRDEKETVLFNREAEAVVIHGPDNACLEKISIPELKPGEVLVEVSYTAVCATDHDVVSGRLGYFKSGLSSFPIVPGHEFSGRIAAVGAKVSDLHEGDPVVVECIQSCGVCASCRSGNFIGCDERTEVGVMRHNGAYATFMVSSSRFVHKLPDDMDLMRAALTEPTAVCLKGIRRLDRVLAGRDIKGMRCAILGAGPLGHLCALILNNRGFDVTAFDRNPDRRKQFDGTKIKTDDQLSSLSGFEVIIEITGDPDVLDHALHHSPANATLLLLGLPYAKREFSFEAIAAYDKTVVGSVGSSKEDFNDAIALISTLDLQPFMGSVFPLSEFETAFALSKSGDVLKVFLQINQSDRPALQR